MGADGWAIERNTRYPDHVDGNEEMLKNLLDGRILNGWSLRKILETQPTYAGAVGAIGDVDDGDTVTDFLAQERARGDFSWPMSELDMTGFFAYFYAIYFVW